MVIQHLQPGLRYVKIFDIFSHSINADMGSWKVIFLFFRVLEVCSWTILEIYWFILQGKSIAVVVCLVLGLGSLVAWNSMLTIGDYYYELFPVNFSPALGTSIDCQRLKKTLLKIYIYIYTRILFRKVLNVFSRQNNLKELQTCLYW